ncbi:MAG: hypothetical protein JXA30_17280 [Deltaproteobacteria bacterium]|nr:hypothetical protein [Deltaproteobacteria bacterium]
MENIVDFVRNYRVFFYFIIAGGLTAILVSCAEGVGDPCMPESIPDDGFNDDEVYIEASSVQCETRVCGVFKFKGDPRNPNNDPVIEGQVKDRVYCTCRCRAPKKGFATCSCPDGFTCTEEDLLDSAGDGLRGGYCVKVKL